MDAIQFGQWLSKRRRMCGWSSQRTLIEAIRKDPTLSTLGISEDFLARLEAGHLHYPFRGHTRRRVLALAYLLCRTPREVQSYQRAAGLNDLSPAETEMLATLTEQLGAPATGGVMLLPPRPTRLVGRTQGLQQILQALREGEPGLYAISGMPGVGKSTLAAEVAHRLASDSNHYRRSFPDGIVTLSGRGYQGNAGLCALLSKILDVFTPRAQRLAGSAETIQTSPPAGNTSESRVGELIDQTRAMLAGKRALLILDDLDPHFPLRQAFTVLLAQGSREGEGLSESSDFLMGSSMLITTRAIPPVSSMMSYHLHLEPLSEEAALTLFASLLDRALTSEEQAAAHAICQAVGGLPPAIELAATAVKAGIDCALLANRLRLHALDPVLDGEGELGRLLDRALQDLPTETREHLLLLSSLAPQTFSLEEAATVELQASGCPQAPINEGPPLLLASACDETLHDREVSLLATCPARLLASTATHLTRLVRCSLLELLPVSASAAAQESAYFARYRIHPLLRAYAAHEQRKRLLDLQAFVKHHQNDLPQLKRHQEALLKAIAQARYAGQDDVLLAIIEQLLRFLGHLPYAEGERILQWGIETAERRSDSLRLARFLNRLGKLHFYRGDFKSARQRFEASLLAGQQAHARRLSRSEREQLARPWANLSFLACEEGDFALAQRYINVFLRIAQESGDVRGTIEALQKQGWYAYRQGYLREAEQALKHAESLFLAQERDFVSPSDRTLLLQLQLLLLRLRGEIARAHATVETLITIMAEHLDPYAVPDTLLDEAEFSYQQGLPQDAHVFALRGIREASRIEASFLHQKGLAILQRISDADALAALTLTARQEGPLQDTSC